MPIPLETIHLAGAPGTEAHELARTTLAKLFPRAVIHEVPDLAAALLSPAPPGPALLVMLEPGEPQLAQAATARDGRGLLRWAIVARTAESSHPHGTIVELAPARWHVTELGVAMKSAERLFALERENGRLRGDLRTIGRRFAHDLRTPLNCITTANEALTEPLSEPTLTALFAQSIASAVDEAALLVDRLSVVLMATALPDKLRPVPMQEIVWGALQRLETKSVKAGATVTQPADWPNVKGVPALIELIWVNLIGNSLRHGGPQPKVRLGWDEAGGVVKFWIRDSGPGVPPGKRGLLFHPLDRLNELNAPRSYGLSIVHRLVELQGGVCAYDPLPAPGGTFSFTLAAA